MVRKTIEQRLAEIENQRKTLKARLGKQERTHDTRRKVLLGTLLLHRLENVNDPEFTSSLRDWLRRELPEFLTRDADKKLLSEFIKPDVAGTVGEKSEEAD